MPDGIRYAIATLAAVLVFLGLYFGVPLVDWAALGLAVAVYGGLLLALPKRRDPSLVLVAPRVSEADLSEARAALGGAKARLNALAPETASEADRGLVLDLAGRIAALEQALADDPGDYLILRRFVTSYLPRMVESVESFVRLGRSASDPEIAGRLTTLRAVLATYPDRVSALTRAALGNDLRALEAEVDALSFQLRRG